MTMTAPNLLPPSVARRTRSTGAARAWTGALAALTVLSGFAVAGALGLAPPSFVDLRSQSLRLNAAADADYALAERFRKDAVAAAQRLELRRAVSGHPDWSRLLALLARVRGDEAVIESVEVKRKEIEQAAATKPGTRAPASADQRPRSVYAVRLAGVAADTAGATALVLRLEQSGAFDRVSLLDTQMREVAGQARTAFSIECEIADAAPAPRAKGEGKPR